MEGRDPPAVSLSHAGKFTAVAIGSKGPVGIDVEPYRPVEQLEPASEIIFAPSERRVLDSVEESGRARTILRTWTAKEAVLKALGVGFALPPHNVLLDFRARTIPEAATVQFEGETRRFRVWSFDAAAHFAAVTAVAGSTGTRLSFGWGDAAMLLSAEGAGCS